jgi:hypothetical protein
MERAELLLVAYLRLGVRVAHEQCSLVAEHSHEQAHKAVS